VTKITNLDRTALQNLRAPIESELAALGERLGISLKLGNGKFGDGAEATFQLVLKVEDEATKTAAAKAAWDRNCQYVGIDFARPDETGLRAEDFGTEFTYGHGPKATRYRTTGIALKGKGSQKFPILVETLGGPNNGKTMMLPEAAVPMIRAATDAKANGLPGFGEFANQKRAEAAAR
jgi:hypothetical protein